MDALNARERVLYEDMAVWLGELVSTRSFDLLKPVGFIDRFNELQAFREVVNSDG